MLGGLRMKKVVPPPTKIARTIIISLARAHDSAKIEANRRDGSGTRGQEQDCPVHDARRGNVRPATNAETKNHWPIQALVASHQQQPWILSLTTLYVEGQGHLVTAPKSRS